MLLREFTSLPPFKNMQCIQPLKGANFVVALANIIYSKEKYVKNPPIEDLNSQSARNCNPMGNSIASSCSALPKERVLVMRDDGSLLMFRYGARAKEVTAAHAGHLLVRCCSNRTIVPDFAELESRRLYFLMPATDAQSREAYERFWRVGETKGLVPPRRPRGESAASHKGRVFLSETPELKITSWRPGSRSVLEITSSTKSSHVMQPAGQVAGGSDNPLVSLSCESRSFYA